MPDQPVPSLFTEAGYTRAQGTSLHHQPWWAGVFWWTWQAVPDDGGITRWTSQPRQGCGRCRSPLVGPLTGGTTAASVTSRAGRARNRYEERRVGRSYRPTPTLWTRRGAGDGSETRE